MIDPKKLNKSPAEVHESMPKGLRDLGEDVEKKIRRGATVAADPSGSG